MSRERFRVRAKDAHFNGQERSFTHPADSEESLRASLAEHAPHLTITSVAPYEQGLRYELHTALDWVRYSDKLDPTSLRVVQERMRCCEHLAYLSGTDSMESLLQVLERFDRRMEQGTHTITGTDFEMFSFGMTCGSKTHPIYGGLIFHRDSRTWGTHT